MLGGGTDRHTRRMKVFLAEDSPLVLERLTQMLAAVPGARVVGHARGAKDAIVAILATKPDVVVLDLNLAQGTGFDVLSAVRESAPATAVYMLSNFVTEPYRRRAEQLGAIAFFDKSSEFERVRDAVAQRAASKP